jgi:hypothetical protein
LEPLINTFISEATKKLIFKFKKDYISMLLDTPEAYVYGEKFYDQSYLISSLSIKIFKQQKHKSLNFNQFRMVITNQFYDEYFDETYLTNFLKKNKIYYHRWHQKGGVINTSSTKEIQKHG